MRSVIPKKEQKDTRYSRLGGSSSDFGNGLSVYFNVTPAFLIIVICSQTGTGRSSFKSIFYFSRHTFWKTPKISRGAFSFFFLSNCWFFGGFFWFFLFCFVFELQGLTAVLVLLGDFFTMWINQCYELGPWGFGNVIGFRWHFASQSVKQPNVDTAEQFQLFPLAPSSFLGRCMHPLPLFVSALSHCDFAKLICYPFWNFFFLFSSLEYQGSPFIIASTQFYFAKLLSWLA